MISKEFTLEFSIKKFQNILNNINTRTHFKELADSGPYFTLEGCSCKVIGDIDFVLDFSSCVSDYKLIIFLAIFIFVNFEEVT